MVRWIALAATAWIAAEGALAAQSVAPAPNEEIIVEGRRTSERYRLPTELRPIATADLLKPPAAADPRLACHGVGAYGCGTEVLPIVTVRGDGSTQIGAEPEER